MGSPAHWTGHFPLELVEKVKELGREWNKLRPKFDPKVEREWDEVIDKWASKSEMPLIIRNSGEARGSEIKHISGREIIISDNSPAQWVCYLALSGNTMSLKEIKRAISDDKIPISFAIRKAGGSVIKHKQTLGSYSINKLGWKLCHKDPVGIGNSENIETMNIDTLIDLFKKLLKPSNFFLIPLKWGGLGELEEFINEIK